MTGGAPQVTQLWLVRHAPVEGEEGRIYGRRDVAASIPPGAAMKECAARLPRGGVWVTSPLRRARDTLDAILAAGGETDVTPLVEPGLAEQDFGAWEGQPAAEVWGGLARELQDDPAAITPPDGESFHDVMRRVDATIDGLIQAHRGATIVAVAHSGAIRAALAKALTLAPEAALRLSIDALSLSRCDHFPDSGGWRVQFINRPGRPEP